MPLQVPKLDDTNWEQLTEEARALIPRYAPDWTDHNVHDPGITLLELLAWLVDQGIYQVGFVSDRHIQAFAALLGVSPHGPKPSRGLLWPHDGAVKDDVSATGTDLKAGTRVACVEQPGVPFELEAEVHISPAQLADTSPQDTGDRVEITAQTKSGRAGVTLPEVHGTSRALELVFDRPLVESRSDEGPRTIAVGVELDTAPLAEPPPPALRGRLLAEYRVGNGTEPWRRVEVVENGDGTHALNRTGTVLIRIPPEDHNPQQKNPSRLRLYTRGRVNPIPPRVTNVALNILPIVQRETHNAAVLGTSNEMPDQAFPFDPPLDGLPEGEDVEIEVAGAGEVQQWRRIKNLTKEGPHDVVFELRMAENEVLFGNGLNGRIPSTGCQIRHRGYHVTLGEAGNLTAGLNWTVHGTPLRPGQSSYGTNRAPLTDGSDATNIAELRQVARERALRRDTLLTNVELEKAAKALPGMAVERAEVVVGFHPALPHRSVPGARALIVTPSRTPDVDPLTPVPPRYLTAVEHALGEYRVLGERLSVLAAARVRVSVEADLLIEDGLDSLKLIARARRRLDARLSDVAHPEEPGVKPWPAGRPVTRKEIKALLAGVGGVIAVTNCTLAKGGEAYADRDLPLARDEIAIGAGHKLNVKALRERPE